MADREKLIELIEAGERCPDDHDPFGTCEGFRYFDVPDCHTARIADHLIANGVTVRECARPLEEWGEDYGDVLWWKFPIEEPPYVGSPLCSDWPGDHTHWTPIPLPEPPKEGE